MLDKLKAEIAKASNHLGSNKLVYEINFWFGCSESVKIAGVELNQNPEYSFFGWNNGISGQDLESLAQQGFLVKISEIIDEQDPLEKSIEYEIKKAI